MKNFSGSPPGGTICRSACGRANFFFPEGPKEFPPQAQPKPPKTPSPKRTVALGDTMQATGKPARRSSSAPNGARKNGRLPSLSVGDGQSLSFRQLLRKAKEAGNVEGP